MIAALFVRSDSIYKTLGIECFDAQRDARTWNYFAPIIAHPPCAQWGKLRKFANVNEEIKDLARWAVRMIREFGGILEHPIGSDLWREMEMPKWSGRDAFGGYTLSIDQHWFGHPCKKPTWLYIVGADPLKLPPMPMNFDAVEYLVSGMRKRKGNPLKEQPKGDRDKTPKAMAEWMIEVCKIIEQNQNR